MTKKPTGKAKAKPATRPKQATRRQAPAADQGQEVARLADDEQELGFAALRTILEDPDTPAAARAGAARTLLEAKGIIGRHAAPPERGDDRPLSTLSRADLEAELDRLRRFRRTLEAER